MRDAEGEEDEEAADVDGEDGGAAGLCALELDGEAEDGALAGEVARRGPEEGRATAFEGR